MNDPFIWALAVAGFLSWALALVIPFQRRRNNTRQYFVLFLFSLGLWAVGSFLCITISATDLSRAAWRTSHIAAVLVPVLFIHFLYVLTQRIPRLLLAGCYAAAMIMAALLFTPLMLGGANQPASLAFQFRPGVFYPLLIAYFFLIWSFAAAYLFLEAGKKEGQRKEQYNLLLLGTVLGFVGHGAAFVLVYQEAAGNLLGYGAFAVFAYVIVMSYAVARYGLLDTDVLLKRGIVLVGLVISLCVIHGMILLAARDIAGQFIAIDQSLAQIAAIFFMVLIYDPLRRLLVNLTDRFLFQRKYNYQKLLKDATAGISKIESLTHLLSLVAHFVTMRVRVKNAAILTKTPGAAEFTLRFQRGYQKNYLNYHIKDTHPLISYLTEEREALDIDRLEAFMVTGIKSKGKNRAKKDYDFQAMKEKLLELDAACCVPSFLGKELKNVLVLGRKKSGSHYSDEDLTLLFTLAQESAIAIENARLFDEAINKSTELEQINSQLEYAKNLLMNALKETEVANKQLQDTQAQLIHEQKMATLGRLAASVGHEVNNPLTILSMNVSRVLLKLRKNPDLKVTDIVDTFEKMEQNIGRIKAVVNTLTGLLKKSEKGKFEPLSLKLILEETLPLVQFQTYLDNLTGTEVDFDVPANLPLIRGDLERLQEVFLNLFINAYHAMQGRQNRRIDVRAEISSEDENLVAVHFKDNGSGMKEEVRKKIFNYGYTTKAPGKGSGLGLYMCKYIIELHGGGVQVQSKLGEGTTFSLTLPVADAPASKSNESRATTG